MKLAAAKNPDLQVKVGTEVREPTQRKQSSRRKRFLEVGTGHRFCSPV